MGPILALSGGTLPFLLFDKDPDAPFYALALFSLLGAGMVAFIGYAILEIQRWQLTISPTLLSVRSVGRYRELPREAVAGFTVEARHTFIHPARAGLPRLKIHETTEHYAAIQRWLAPGIPT
ncbi:hypothetical protein CDA63_00545 [Hymenobacter amundsenii]|uniref:DUF304 domain-containing protein n=1 Tax=Hymenobacter amundsenii TaxID=2006685 RepID=A0A246FQ53_9BACT|nr:hypothetical protein CDA63_00545 [Hymenobacter amundsenii]